MDLFLVNHSDIPRTEVFTLGQHLGERGHQVTILYPSDGKRIPAHGKVDVVPFPARFLPKIHYVLPNFRRQYKLLQDLTSNEGYELIQACDYDYLTSVPPILLKRKRGTPLVLTTDAFPGLSWFFGDRFVDGMARIYTRTIGKRILNAYDRLVLLSSRLVNDAVTLGVPREKIHVIPIGVELSRFRPGVDGSDLRSDLGIRDDERVILFVGRLALVKRVDMLIELSRLLSREGVKFRMVIVGDGEYGEYYRQMAQGVDNVIFLGPIPPAKMPRYYALADIVILPSLSEGLPNVLLEASASGKPVIATDVGGIRDIVLHGTSGYLFGAGDLRSLHTYTMQLLSDTGQAERMGRAGFKHVSEHFSWGVVTDAYEAMYLELLNACPEAT
jgi:glycosyltransferase involved in cell wall biosynthesis